jgi:hypothetical protein
MAKMEFLSQNLLNSVSTITVDSNSTLTGNLHDRNKNLKYTTLGYGSDTSTIISVEFSNPTIISHILLLNHNFKSLRIFYDSVTANVLTPDFQTTTNAQTNLYLGFSSVTVSSINVQIDTAMTTDTEKSIGELVVANRKLQFDQNPESKKYKPVIDRMQVEHKMPDGGIVQYNIKDKFTAEIGFKFITETFYDSLLALYEEAIPMYFIPFPTTTAWDGRSHPVIWSGDFDFKHSVNTKASGFTGKIKLKERTSS